MSLTEGNKAFIAEMIGTKKRLEDYPDRYDPDLVMHEPASLPFGGTYKGLAEFQAFYPTVREFYDFSRFELLGVYGDGDMVFATVRAAVAGTGGTIHLAEQFRFSGSRIVEVRLHICDDEVAAEALRRR
jgi:hypothetical protein